MKKSTFGFLVLFFLTIGCSIIDGPCVRKNVLEQDLVKAPPLGADEFESHNGELELVLANCEAQPACLQASEIEIVDLRPNATTLFSTLANPLNPQSYTPSEQDRIIDYIRTQGGLNRPSCPNGTTKTVIAYHLYVDALIKDALGIKIKYACCTNRASDQSQ